MSNEFIKIEGDFGDTWVCICGNTPYHEGFHWCDIEGNLLDDESRYYRCDSCGRIIDAETLQVVAYTQKHK